jgi:hypothetical protein
MQILDAKVIMNSTKAGQSAKAARFLGVWLAITCGANEKSRSKAALLRANK